MDELDAETRAALIAEARIALSPVAKERPLLPLVRRLADALEACESRQAALIARIEEELPSEDNYTVEAGNIRAALAAAGKPEPLDSDAELLVEAGTRPSSYDFDLVIRLADRLALRSAQVRKLVYVAPEDGRTS